MITAFIETASSRLGIAITRDGRLLSELSVPAPGGTQNQLLYPFFEQALTTAGIILSDLNLLATSAGPGSFTGVRNGLVMVQGLAFAQDIPCVAVSSLTLLAANLYHAALPVCVMVDARKQEVYSACYQVQAYPTLLTEESALPPDTLCGQIQETTIFVGDGALLYHDRIVAHLGSRAIFAPEQLAVPRPAIGCHLAEQQFAHNGPCPPEQLLPRYLRLSEAEVALNKRQNCNENKKI